MGAMEFGRESISGAVIAALGLGLLAAAPAAAETLTSTAPVCVADAANPTRLVEWDLDFVSGDPARSDARPGAIVVDNQSSRRSRIWFVTRAAETRLYRLLPGLKMRKDAAQATSW